MPADRERWYDIRGYRGIYQVSDRGRVHALARIDASGHRRSGRLLAPQVSGSHRRYYVLCAQGVPRLFCASVLVAQALNVPNPRRCDYVVHRNHVNTDYRRRNLKWATLVELRMHDGIRFSCPYYGVTLTKRGGGVLRWQAALRIAGKRHELGRHATAEEAAYAYDLEVRRLDLDRPLNGVRKPAAFRIQIPSLSGEVWRPFPGASRTHMISNRGRVRTLAHVTGNGVRVLPKLRKLSVNPSGSRTIAIRQRRYTIRNVVEQVFG